MEWNGRGEGWDYENLAVGEVGSIVGECVGGNYRLEERKFIHSQLVREQKRRE